MESDRHCHQVPAPVLYGIKMIPEYTRAINGLANIQLFVLEDLEKALDYYEAALGYDRANTAALFGKGPRNPVRDEVAASRACCPNRCREKQGSCSPQMPSEGICKKH